MKYTTYQYTGSKNPKLKATCLITHLDAQKHLLLNTVYRGVDSKSEEVIKTKAAGRFIRNDDPYLSQMLDLVESCKDERFFAFNKSFPGKKPAEKLHGWIEEILEAFPCRKMCLQIYQFAPNLYTLNDGEALRLMLPFAKECSPISLRILEEDKLSTYAYLMLMEVATP